MFCTFLESQVATSTRFPRQILVRTQKFARKMRTVGLVDYSLQCASTRFRAPPHVELLCSVWAGRRTGRTLQLFGWSETWRVVFTGTVVGVVLLLAPWDCVRVTLKKLHADTKKSAGGQEPANGAELEPSCHSKSEVREKANAAVLVTLGTDDGQRSARRDTARFSARYLLIECVQTISEYRP